MLSGSDIYIDNCIYDRHHCITDSNSTNNALPHDHHTGQTTNKTSSNSQSMYRLRPAVHPDRNEVKQVRVILSTLNRDCPITKTEKKHGAFGFLAQDIIAESNLLESRILDFAKPFRIIS